MKSIKLIKLIKLIMCLTITFIVCALGLNEAKVDPAASKKTRNLDLSFELPMEIKDNIQMAISISKSILISKLYDEEKEEVAMQKMKEISKSIKEYFNKNNIRGRFSEYQIKRALDDAGYFELTLFIRQLEMQKFIAK